MESQIQVEAVKVGDIFYESWGYDQTQNDFCQVVRISPSGKTAICRMVHLRGVTDSTVEPTGEQYGIEFRMKLDHWVDNEGIDHGTYLRGSYPFIQEEKYGRPRDDKNVDYRGPVSFSKYKGEPVYETPAGFGH